MSSTLEVEFAGKIARWLGRGLENKRGMRKSEQREEESRGKFGM